MAQLNFNELLKGEFVPSTEADWDFLRAASHNLFMPKTPIDDDKLFASRLSQISDVLDAVYEKGGHAVIFGERGVFLRRKREGAVFDNSRQANGHPELFNKPREPLP